MRDAVRVAIVERRDDVLFEEAVERRRIGCVDCVVVVARFAAVDHPAVRAR